MASLQRFQLRDGHFSRLNEPCADGWIAGVSGSDLDVVAVGHDVDAAGGDECLVADALDIGSHILEIILQAVVDRRRPDSAGREVRILRQRDL